MKHFSIIFIVLKLYIFGCTKCFRFTGGPEQNWDSVFDWVLFC